MNSTAAARTTLDTSAEPAVRSPITRSQPTSVVAATKMRALVANRYGGSDVLELKEIERPTAGAGEIVVRVHATVVTAADSMMRRGDPAYARLFLGLMKPKAAVPGTGFAGIVESIGEDVTTFAVGDAVFGESGVSFGAHAEYLRVSADGVVLRKPDTISFEDAATLCDGPMTSFNFLRRMADVQPGQKVLINGASGALGTAAVQLAKAFGAHVTGVCSGANVELVMSLGADEAIDYTREDFTKRRDRYDFVYDTVGKSSFSRCKRSLRAGGAYLSPVLSLPLLLQMMWTALFGAKKARFDATGLRAPAELREILDQLVRLTESGELRAVVEREYALDDSIDAHAHVDTGRKKGTVIVRMPAAARARGE
jgi:NADPH:quinone reductase-like Zn-dependent oxidoreductase